MLTKNKSEQKAGNNSNQILANTINVTNINGIDEKRARAIFSEMFEVVRRDFTQEANLCASQRVAIFEEILIPKMAKIDGAIEMFADPSFQFLLTEAHRTAAATEREFDYELLSELLIHRVNKGDFRKTRVGIERAVEIVDKIDDDALCALTMAHAVAKLRPVPGIINAGLDVLQGVFDKLEYKELPSGTDWIEHLEILDAVRISGFGELKKIKQYYTECLDGYVCAGIEKNTENYKKAQDILKSIDVPQALLIDNELIDGFARLSIPSSNQYDKIIITTEHKSGGVTQRREEKITEKQVKGLVAVKELYDKSKEMKVRAEDAFMNEWEKRDSLRRLKEWWDSIPIVFNVTAVGTVLAHANAQTRDSNIPSLE